MWPSTPAERRHLAWRCRTCCLRRFRASRPPQNSSFRGSIPHPIRSLCTLRTRRRRRLRNTRFPAARYHLTGADLSPAETRQLRLTHRNRKFESISLQQRVTCELDFGRDALCTGRVVCDPACRRPAPGDAALPPRKYSRSIASTNASTLPLIGFYTPSDSHLLRPATRTKFSFMPP